MCDKIAELKDNKETIKLFVAGGIPYYRKLMYYYKYNMEKWKAVFNEFYNIRGLKKENRSRFFKLFDKKIKELKSPTFDDQSLKTFLVTFLEETKTEVTRKNGQTITRYNLSFVSKLLHTYAPEKFIIYDKHVLSFFGKRNLTGAENKAALYFKLKKEYDNNQEIKGIADFFKCFGDISDISTYKKIDFMIWGYGRWKEFEKKYPSKEQPEIRIGKKRSAE